VKHKIIKLLYGELMIFTCRVVQNQLIIVSMIFCHSVPRTIDMGNYYHVTHIIGTMHKKKVNASLILHYFHQNLMEKKEQLKIKSEPSLILLYVSLFITRASSHKG
jgi:hypothetical protein